MREYARMKKKSYFQGCERGLKRRVKYPLKPGEEKTRARLNFYEFYLHEAVRQAFVLDSLMRSEI